MRVVKQISHLQCRITLFNWNNRYLIKMERGGMEQTYKIDQFEVEGDAMVEKLIDETFIAEVVRRFDDMQVSLHTALQRHLS